MSQRINVFELAPAAVKAIYSIEQYVQKSSLEHSLVALIKLRVSYQNGCAFCVDMHTKEARVAGESEQRLFAVPVWRETPFFNPRERAALAFAEAVTELGKQGVSDALYRQTRELFSEQELVELTLAVIGINAWNRLAISFAAEPGSYQPQSARHS